MGLGPTMEGGDHRLVNTQDRAIWAIGNVTFLSDLLDGLDGLAGRRRGRSFCGAVDIAG